VFEVKGNRAPFAEPLKVLNGIAIPFQRSGRTPFNLLGKKNLRK